MSFGGQPTAKTVENANSKRTGTLLMARFSLREVQ
jgi:hypothetical protein